MCLLFVAGSGGPASRARCGASHLFLWPLCLSALLGPLRAGVAPRSLAALAVPRCLGAVLWLFFSASRCLALRALARRLCLPLGRWLLFGGFSPHPLPFCALVFSSLLLGALVFFFFFFSLLPLCAPIVSGFLWFPAPGALGLGAVRCLLCWPSASRLSVRLSLFRAFLLAGACSLSVAGPPPPSPPFLSRGFRRCRSVLCAVCCVVLCVPGCGAVPCCARWVPLLVAPCPLALPVALGPCALRRCVLRCSPVLCVFCRGAVVRAVVGRSALCCVCPGVLCCAFPVLSAPCGVCFAVLVRLRCAVRVVLAVAGAWCCGVPWCGAGSGGPWLSAGGVFRCRCPCLAPWSVSLWLVWFAVVPCFPVSCSVVLCCRVVLCCCALLSCCGAVWACFALL